MSKTVEAVSGQHGVSPLTAFSGPISPTKTGLLYSVGLAVVAFAMVLLPLIYLTLIAFAAWGVFLHLRYDTWLMAGGGGHASLLKVLVLYLGPAIVGAILIFFMIKPFFAGKVRAAEPLTLDPAKEPLLFSFVNKICGLIGAPVPSRIEVDCEVNASARLQRGLWSKDLALSIGLPLVSGLDMRQFGGVLAHEFGHFAQSAGMRSTYIIRKINFWFARVVYERDEWDIKLEESARSADLRIGIVLHAARGCVWLTRRILVFLMQIGHAISCFMLRQMEYDADSCESKVAGSDAFEATAARLRVLNVATQNAYEDLRQSWASKRLPENLPLLIGHKASLLPPEIDQKLSASASSGKTGWFDTHPCDADRIRAARRLNEPGVFRLTAPAGNLFDDFAQLSRAVTRHEYEKNLKLDFTEQNLMPAEEILRESTAIAEAEAMIAKFYGSLNISLKPLLVTQAPPLTSNPQTVAVDWRAARDSTETLREAGEKVSAEYAGQQQKLIELHSARTLVKAGFKLEIGAFGLPVNATSPGEQAQAAQAAIQETTASMAQHLAKLEPFMAALRQRVMLALSVGQTDAAVLRKDSADELTQLVPLVVAVSAEMPRAHEIGLRLLPFRLLAQNSGNSSTPADVDRAAAEIMTDLQNLITGLQERLAPFNYPFPHARGKLSVAEYARNDKPAENEWQRVYEEASTHVDRLFALHYRLIGRLLAHANAGEVVLENLA